jgi:ligand-binding SRPBCC domain-containing protein
VSRVARYRSRRGVVALRKTADKACDHGAVAVRFQRVTTLGIPPTEAFDLSLSVAAHVASMARSRERAIGRITSDSLVLGDEITWHAWHFGVPWRLTTRITEFDRPQRFIDEQVRGPFHRFRHEHLFEPFDGGSRMTDIVEFEAPGGRLGRLAERWVLASYLQRLIDERNRYLAEQPAQ